MKKICAFLFIFLINSSVIAQTTAILNFSPGGGLDISMRHFQKYMQQKHNININFLFKSGAEGLIGLNYLNEVNDPDNVMGFTTLAAIVVAEKRGLKFNYVSATRQYANVLITNSTSEITSYLYLQESLRRGKSFTFGQGSPAHATQIKQLLGQIGPANTQVIVNYRGAGDVVKDMIGNHITLAILPFGVVQQVADNGSIRILASTQRLSDDIPLLKITNTSGYGVVLSNRASETATNKWIMYLSEYINDNETQKTFKYEVSESYSPGPMEMHILLDKIRPLIQ